MARKVDKWAWQEFENKAREDNYRLKHWSKTKEVDQQYPFEKVNYKVEIVKYDDKEYDEVLADIHPGWSRAETDYLWDLCELFDLRFVVIQD